MDLKSLTDQELLKLLDDVSEEIKSRNELLPKTAGEAAVDLMKVLQELASAPKTTR